MNINFSDRASNLQPAAVRNKLFDDPEIIAFAAGKPEQEFFPLHELSPLAEEIIRKEGAKVFQYGPTEGIHELREIIVTQRMKACGVETTSKNIVLTNGSQEAIEFSAKLFLNEGDTVICERPSYTGLFEAFAPYSPNYVSIPMDENGMIMEELESALQNNNNVKLIYTIPDSQNPTGITMSDDRRKRLAELAATYQIPVIEDTPYADIIYEGNRHPSVKSFDSEGWVVMLGSFSKTFCPGLRIGWICAEEEIVQKYALAKEGSTLQCGTFDQYLTAAYLKKYDFNAHLNEIIELYRVRRDATLQCIDEFFPKDIKRTNPIGGFFVWIELKKEIDTFELFVDAATKSKVSFVPGKFFFADEGYNNYMRLSYSSLQEDKIREGLRRLGELVYTKY